MAIPSFKKIKAENKLQFLRKKTAPLIKVSWWFSLGVVLGFFFFASFLYIFYTQSHKNTVYEGILVDGVNFGGKTQEDVRVYFARRNKKIQKVQAVIIDKDSVATISARQIGFGYDENLLAKQAIAIGRSGNQIADMSLILQAYLQGIKLPAAYHYTDDRLNVLLTPIKKLYELAPVEALFTFENGRVVAFRPSSEGRTVDVKSLKQTILKRFTSSLIAQESPTIQINLPVTTVKPAVTTDKANGLGIRELIGEGTSLFYHSIENRIYNINLAASRFNGLLIPPGEVFSFDKVVGDVSSLTGYKQAYVIENGKTVLGDGGGVCQVSTTLFRAALNAGLPIVERHQHAYRVGYYEEDSPPGIDAAIYSPTVDMKFKNDTGHYILVQTSVDQNNYRLTFDLYGTSDGRQATVNQPVILSQSPAPDPLYQDDPTLPKGEIKQVDFSAAGANIYFTRTVTRNGKTILSDKFVSNYRPWQAVFLRGTKE
jgi:vancomycin resistance protein YoaR